MSSNTPNDQSIWDILDALESKLIHSFHSTSDILLPQIIESSNQLYTQLESVSHQIYQKSLELGSKSDIFSTILPSPHEPPLSISHSLLIPSPQPSPPTLLRRLLKSRTIIITAGLWLTSTLALRLVLSSESFHQFLQAHPHLRRALPRALRARRRSPKTIIRPRYSTGGNTRLEAVVILCADPGSIGSQLAIELAGAGYMVIASVSHPSGISTLERDGLGWIKALVLDPTRPELAPAFTRSLASALSLRFPLNSAGDAFLGEGMHSLLVGMINCYPVGSMDELRPVETLEPQIDLLACFNKTVCISLEVVKVVLPMMRNSIEKHGGADGVILTLLPTKTSSVALPYLSSSVIANQSLETLMTTLRRELMISDSPSKHKIRIINERIGLFKPLSHFPRTSTSLPSLPVHLHPIYAPSLSRRLGFLALPTTHLPVHSVQGSPLTQLFARVQRVLQSPHITKGSATAVGKEVWTYRFISTLVPDRTVELWLRVVERMNGWVRRRVASEIDLESAETLEQVITKRDFSVGSGWKHGAFGAAPLKTSTRVSTEEALGVEEEEKEVASAPAEEVSSEAVKVALAEPEEASAVEPETESGGVPVVEGDVDAAAEEAEKEETMSCVDKGEAEEMQESFVGSEVDWKAQEETTGTGE